MTLRRVVELEGQMPERDQLAELATMLARDAAEKLVHIPGVDAVCVTLVGSGSIPLGIILMDPDKCDGLTSIRAIRKLSDHIEVLARAIEEQHAKSGQDGPSLGESGHAQHQPDGSRTKAGDEVQRDDQTPARDVGQQDPSAPRRAGDRQVDGVAQDGGPAREGDG